jgi:hypothetical protein
MNQDSRFISELKFVLSDKTARDVREWSRVELEPDPHSIGDSYRTCSLYFDTEDFDMFLRHGSYGRAKFRIRNYNGGSTVFLERKMKENDRVLKRRSEVDLSDLARLSDYEDSWTGGWFARRLQHRRLRPVCQILYLRTAKIGMCSSGPLRLTIDEHVRATPIDRIAFTNEAGVEVLPGQHILELKYHVHVPVLFKCLIEEFRLAPQRVSKYRVSGQMLNFNRAEEGTECLTF